MHFHSVSLLNFQIFNRVIDPKGSVYEVECHSQVISQQHVWNASLNYVSSYELLELNTTMIYM